MRIGFIGLGLMGSRMARRLLDEEYLLTVTNRTPKKAQTLLDAGADWAGGPSEAVHEADVVWTMLSTPDVVRSTALGEGGFLRQAAPGALWIDSSTVDPETSRALARQAAEQDVGFLDAPVSGSTRAAETGQLLFLVGGAEKHVALARPLLEAVGRKVIHVGDVGEGSALKLVFNQLLGTVLLGGAEALRLGEALGLDRARLLEALEDCDALPGRLRDRLRDDLAVGDYEPGFPLKWIEKDLGLALESGVCSGAVLPMTASARTVYGQARQCGWGNHGITAVAEFLYGRCRSRTSEQAKE